MTAVVTGPWTADLDDVPVGLVAAHGVVVLAGGDGRAIGVSVESGRVLAEARLDGGLLGCSVAPSGHAAVLTGVFGAWLWSLTDGSLVALAENVWSAASAWTTDRRVAVAAGRRVLVVEDGVPIWVSDPFASTVADLCWVGGRRRIAVAAYGGVHLAEPRPHGAVSLLPFTGSLLGIAATGNGRWIVSGNQDASLQVFRTDRDDRLEMSGYPDKIHRLAFDATGRFLANDGARDVTVWDFGGPGPRGRSPVLVASPDDAGKDLIGDFDWHPTAQRLVVGWQSGAVADYAVRSGVRGHRLPPTRMLTDGTEPVRKVAWTVDGQAVIVARGDGRISRHDVAGTE